MNIIDIFLHLDKYLQIQVIPTFGIWTYALLFLIIFVETGVIVLPFLPGDSLLFIVGALAAAGSTQSLGPNFIWIAAGVMIVAAIMGDTTNFHIGKAIGPKIFKKENARFFNRNNLLKANAFYEKYGGKVIILARFIPVIRDFAPFVAGIGKMNYGRFILYNIIGGAAWVVIGLSAGFLFGKISFIQENFSIAMLTIVFISCLPMILSYFIGKKKKRMA